MATNRLLWVDGKCHTPTSIICYAIIIVGPRMQANANPLTETLNVSDWMKLRADNLHQLEGRHRD